MIKYFSICQFFWGIYGSDVMQCIDKLQWRTQWTVSDSGRNGLSGLSTYVVYEQVECAQMYQIVAKKLNPK